MRNTLRRRVVVLAAVLCAAGSLSAQAPVSPPWPHPLAARLAAASEPLPLDALMDAALAFSGVSDAALPAYRQRLEATVARFQQYAADTPSPSALAERALAFLHDGILRRYDVREARVDVLLDEGTFNCVSSSVLYLVLARSVGLTVGGVRTTDHAFCTVKVGSSTVDVETTNPYGYDPGSRTEFTDSFGRVTGFAYVPPSNYRERAAIGERGLLSLILYDRASFATRTGDHAAALEPAVTGWTLAGDALSRSTLRTVLSNRAVELGQANRFADAVAFLDEAERRFGADADLVERRRELVHNQVVALVESGDLDAAERLLVGGARAELFEAKDRAELRVWIVLLRADRSARASGYASAAAAVADGIATIGADSELLAAFEVYTHNAFAQLYNARRFAEAKGLLEAAMARYPASRVIRADLDTTQKALRE